MTSLEERVARLEREAEATRPMTGELIRKLGFRIFGRVFYGWKAQVMLIGWFTFITLAPAVAFVALLEALFG